ncbi:type 1 fimbrial protein [Enterobacter hormaechei]|nr:type 1 fimbrial protein [Enterobacter hormaechei]
MLSVKHGANLIAPVGVVVMVLLTGINRAAASDTIADGDNGTLYVNGELTRGACNIETASRWQTISMGDVTTGELKSPGDRGHATAVHLHLRDCTEDGPDEGRKREGPVVRVVDQPEVRVSFLSERDADNGELYAVQGAKGFGLRLEDADYHIVDPGDIPEPLAIEPGSDELTYWLQPERTHARLQEGAWRSVINMRFSYE